jgi:hypothetical protein
MVMVRIVFKRMLPSQQQALPFIPLSYSLYLHWDHYQPREVISLPSPQEPPIMPLRFLSEDPLQHPTDSILESAPEVLPQPFGYLTH